ncbi:vacuolar transporter chaperone [Coemansia sp. RSA 552]|nr:vacuolar transporter chaperone [Coemansia sp. RSA 552]
MAQSPAGPEFAEWTHYNADDSQLATLALALAAPCACLAAHCGACDDMTDSLGRELDKAGLFAHISGSESERAIAACEQHVRAAAAALDADERRIGLGQAEEAAGSATAQVLALARFRRSNFAVLWHQLRRLHAHCVPHAARVLERLAASPLFAESSAETLQLVRVAQAHAAIHACCSGPASLRLAPPLLPSLARWRAWVYPTRLRRLLRVLRSRLHRCAPPSRLCSAYLDAPALPRYHRGLLAEASACDSLSLQWQPDAPARLAHDVLYGPWLADRRCAAAVSLEPHQVLPFLEGELNLNRLAEPPAADADACARRRDVLRCAQKIQKKIIMEDLRPLVHVSEDCHEFVDPLVPGFRVVLRSDVSLTYDSHLAERLFGSDEPYDADPDSTVDLTFALVEVQLGPDQELMPPWLADLFFESSLVHPVLDFDPYVHAIAVLRPDLATAVPYWMVDCCRAPFAGPLHATPTSSPSTCASGLHPPASAADHAIEIPAALPSALDIPDMLSPEHTCSWPSESTRLLPSPVSASRSPLSSPRSGSALSIRRYLTIALAIATALSIAISIWPHRQQVCQIVIELMDLISQWIGRLVRLPM